MYFIPINKSRVLFYILTKLNFLMEFKFFILLLYVETTLQLKTIFLQVASIDTVFMPLTGNIFTKN